MMADSITFSIHPDVESLSLRLFLDTIRKIQQLVEDVDYAVTRERKGRLWVVSALHSTAPTITIRPIINGTQTVDAIATGLRMVTAEYGVEPPPFFSADALDDLRKMRDLFAGRQRARRVVFSSDQQEIATIDAGISEKVDRILRGTYYALGSIEGMLEAANFHSRKNVLLTVWDRVSGSPIRCTVPKEREWTAKVKQLLEGRVLVVGRVNYFSNGKPRSVTQIRELRDMTPDPSLPRARFGSIPDLTGDQDPAEYLRTMRE